LPNKTVTTQGLAWDQIAKKKLGGEFQMHRLLAENWKARGVLLFSGDIEVDLPAGVGAQSPVQSLPPWKK